LKSKDFQIIDIWVGHFRSREALNEYLKETYDDDDRPISQLAADVGESMYDHDFLEHSFNNALDHPLEVRLANHSFSASYAEAAQTAFDATPTGHFNTVLLVWGPQFRQPVSINNNDYWLHYLGRFPCNPDA